MLLGERFVRLLSDVVVEVGVGRSVGRSVVSGGRFVVAEVVPVEVVRRAGGVGSVE